jgi:phosphoglycolate phosphatase
MRYRALLLDFDFTMGDSAEGIIYCANTALRGMGLDERSPERIMSTIGFSLREKYIRLTGDTDPGRGEEFVRRFIEAADADMTRMATLYPETLPLIEDARSAGMNVGVVTTKYRRRITEILDKYEVPDAVDIIIGGDSVENPKPAPDGLLLASKILGIPVSDMLYVGDSPVDAQAAASAGMDFVGVLTGTTSREQFLDHPHIAILESIGSLRGILKI